MLAYNCHIIFFVLQYSKEDGGSSFPDTIDHNVQQQHIYHEIMHPYVRANNLKDTSQLHSHVRQHQQNVQNILINTERNNRDVPFDNRYAFEHYSDYNLSIIMILQMASQTLINCS